MKVTVEIEYCVGCRWLLRAAWTAQELLTSFESDLLAVSLKPSDQPGTFCMRVDGACIWDRKTQARFPEMKELKQLLRDRVDPDRDLGHSDCERRKGP
jgi:selenoprotein W-related protein